MKNALLAATLLLGASLVIHGCHQADALTTDAGSDGGTDDTDDTDDSDSATYPEGDCDNLNPGPFTLSPVPGAIASEDIGFDDVGNLVGSDNTAIFKTPLDGSPQLFVAGLDFRAGMRYLPDGHLMVNHDTNGNLLRIDPEGEKHVVLSGLAYPNGMTVDPEGYVYVTEHDAGRVLRVHPYTNEYEVLVSGMSSPNGITFNRDYTLLYIDTFNGDDNTIYTVEIDITTGEHGPLTGWVWGVGSGWHDGLGVDACGNVYVCDYVCFDNWDDTCIYRISEDGIAELDPIIDPPAMIYLPNLDWGSGIGGWDDNSIYMPNGWDHNVYEAHIGVPGKLRVYPPY
jgi:hypothetical protein